MEEVFEPPTFQPKGIVAIGGTQGSGKSTLAGKLRDLFLRGGATSARVFSVAEPIKQAFSGMVRSFEELGYFAHLVPGTRERFEGSGGKNRDFLRILGTEWGRNRVAHTLWSGIARGRAQSYLGASGGVVLFDDIRFPDELDEINPEWKILLTCARETARKRIMNQNGAWGTDDNHESETALCGYEDKFDLILSTDGFTDEELAQYVFRWIKENPKGFKR